MDDFERLLPDAAMPTYTTLKCSPTWLEIKHLSADCRTIKIEQSMWAGKLQTPKTKNAFREVDLSPDLANLRTFLQ